MALPGDRKEPLLSLSDREAETVNTDLMMDEEVPVRTCENMRHLRHLRHARSCENM